MVAALINLHYTRYAKSIEGSLDTPITEISFWNTVVIVSNKIITN